MSCLPVPPGCHPPPETERTPTIVTSPRRIVIGVDTHLDTIHLAASTDSGQPLGDAEFRTNPTGYYVATTWARSFGEVFIAGVEGTSSYGAGFTQVLQDNAIHVVEVNRPDRAARRCHGKSDPLDAYSAAIQQIKDLLVTAPADLRERYRGYPTTLRLAQALARCRPAAHDDPSPSRCSRPAQL